MGILAKSDKFIETMKLNTNENNISYIEANNFYFNKSIVKNSQNKWGVINTNFEVIVPFVYDNIHDFTHSNYLIGVSKNDKWGFININTNQISIPLKFKSVLPFVNSKYTIAQDFDTLKYGLINHKGEWIVLPHFVKGSYDYNHDREGIFVFEDENNNVNYFNFESKKINIIL